METTVNSRIQVLKSELRLNTMDFCAKAKISNGTFHNIKIGENVNQRTLNNIIENLNVNPDWLINGKGKMFADAPKMEANGSVIDPWKDALVMQVKEENSRLVEQVRWLQQMVSQFTNGVKPNFLKATDAANMFMFPNQSQLIKIRAKA